MNISVGSPPTAWVLASGAQAEVPALMPLVPGTPTSVANRTGARAKVLNQTSFAARSKVLAQRFILPFEPLSGHIHRVRPSPHVELPGGVLSGPTHQLRMLRIRVGGKLLFPRATY